MSRSSSRWGGAALQGWIASLRVEGLEPELLILEQVPARSQRVGVRHPDVAEAEDRWIVRLLDEGHSLTNSRIPGTVSERDEQLFKDAMERGREMFGNE